MIYLDYLCLKCGKSWDQEVHELVFCPKCGNWEKELIKPFRFWLGTKHERIELGLCKRHQALVPKVGGCPQCFKEGKPQFPKGFRLA